MNIRRVCAAVFRDGRVLLVRHVEGARDFWTLPGGGVEAGESPEAAALRELQEETGLLGTLGRVLFDRPMQHPGEIERCFLAEVSADQVPAPGQDPELSPGLQVIREVRWTPLEAFKDDRQGRLLARAYPAGSDVDTAPPSR